MGLLKRIASVAFVVWIMGSLGLFGQGALKRVSRAEAMSSATTKVQPVFPSVAKQLKLEGTVELEAVVSESGAVDEVNITSGNPIFTKPAAEAVKRWKFAPFLQDGKPVKVLAPLSIVFKQ